MQTLRVTQRHTRQTNQMLCLLGLLAVMPAVSVAQDDRTKILELVKVPSGSENAIQLPIRFHIVRGAVMTKKRVTMKMWLSSNDVRRSILPEINRIWRSAGITWVVESVVEDQVADLPNRRELLGDISRSTRETRGRTEKILKLIDMRSRHPVINNLYFFPYVGETSQGFALPGGAPSPTENPDGGSRCVVCVWTDKPSNAKKPPQKFGLRQRLPFKIGSIGRTCAHELGHNLLLQHPGKETQTEFHRLMGGKRHGYRLVSDEVALARTVALGRASNIMAWAERKP